MTFQSRKEDEAQRNSLNTMSDIAAEEGTTISSPRGHDIDRRTNAIAMTQAVEPYRTLLSDLDLCTGLLLDIGAPRLYISLIIRVATRMYLTNKLPSPLGHWADMATD
jgi:hypothetical protein